MNRFQSPDGMHLGASKEVFEKAKMLRNNLTSQEVKLWKTLKPYRKKGDHFRQQHPIGSYVADFYCHSLRLVIEVDGKNHQLNTIKELDQEKEDFLNENNIKVIRFTNDQVDYSLDDVMSKIDSVIHGIDASAAGTL